MAPVGTLRVENLRRDGDINGYYDDGDSFWWSSVSVLKVALRWVM